MWYVDESWHMWMSCMNESYHMWIIYDTNYVTWVLFPTNESRPTHVNAWQASRHIFMSHVTYSFVGQGTHVTRVTSHMKESYHMSLVSLARVLTLSLSCALCLSRLFKRDKAGKSLSRRARESESQSLLPEQEKLTLTLSCTPRETHSHSLLRA